MSCINSFLFEASLSQLNAYQLCSGSSPGHLPHSHLQPLLPLTDRAVIVGILCLRGCKRTMPPFSPSLHCCSAPCPAIPWTQSMSTSCVYMGLSAVDSNHLPNQEGHSSDGHWHVLVQRLWNSPRVIAHMGTPIIGQVSITLELEPVSRPLATPQESVKTQM